MINKLLYSNKYYLIYIRIIMINKLINLKINKMLIFNMRK